MVTVGLPRNPPTNRAMQLPANQCHNPATQTMALLQTEYGAQKISLANAPSTALTSHSGRTDIATSINSFTGVLALTLPLMDDDERIGVLALTLPLLDDNERSSKRSAPTGNTSNAGAFKWRRQYGPKSRHDWRGTVIALKTMPREPWLLTIRQVVVGSSTARTRGNVG